MKYRRFFPKGKKTLIFLCVAFLFVFLPKISIAAVTINFDELTSVPSESIDRNIPYTYKGLYWGNFGYIHKVNTYNPSGYAISATSASNSAYSAWGNIATISAKANSKFSLYSAKITSVWRDNLILLVKGYDVAGTLKFLKSITLSATQPTTVTFNFVDVNHVEFTTSGGSLHAAYPLANDPNSDYHFAIDDIFVEPPTIPATEEEGVLSFDSTGTTQTQLKVVLDTSKMNMTSSQFNIIYVERATGQGGFVGVKQYSPTQLIQNPVFTNTGLNSGTTYSYRMRQFLGNDYTPYSNIISTTTPSINAPSELVAEVTEDKKVRLKWKDNSTGETGFEIEKGVSGLFSKIGEVGANTLSFIDTGASGYETYRVRTTFSGSQYSGYSNTAKLPDIPPLGSYGEKLAALQASVFVAKNALQSRRDAELFEQKGAQVLMVTDEINGPLFILKNLEKYLQTDSNGSLRDHAGLVRFFTYLKYMSGFSDPSLSAVFARANDLVGFSYLYPPSPLKPFLISIAGAGGEGGWRGALPLLNSLADDFNIVVYTYDAAVVSSQMTSAFLSAFSASGLAERDNIFVTLSMGSTLMHAVILQNAQSGGNLFSESYVVSTGFVGGGAREFLGPVSNVVPLFPYAYPISRGMVSMMNPLNPLYSSIANNMVLIHDKIKGIHYIHAVNDHHIDFSSIETPYATNRDKTFAGMTHETYVTPPNLYTNNAGQVEQNNQHINLLYAPEVKSRISTFRTQIFQGSSGGIPYAPGMGAFTWLERVFESVGSFIPPIRIASFAQAQTVPTEFYLFDDLLGGPKESICDAVEEALFNSILISAMNYDTYASNIEEYLSAMGATCSLESVLEDSAQEFKDLQILPLSENIPVSGETSLALSLDFDQIDSISLVVDGKVMSSNTSSPWALDFYGTSLANGSHTVSAVIFFVGSQTSVTTPAVVIQTENSIVPTVPVITFSANPSPVPYGENVTLIWSADGAAFCSGDTTMQNPPPKWADPGASGELSFPMTALAAFSLNCQGLGGFASKNLEVMVMPFSLSVTPAEVSSGSFVTVKWVIGPKAENCVTDTTMYEPPNHWSTITGSGEFTFNAFSDQGFQLACEETIVPGGKKLGSSITKYVHVLSEYEVFAQGGSGNPAGNPPGGTTGGSVASGVLNRLITYIFNPLIYLLIGITVIVFLWGAVEFVANAGDQAKRIEGRKHLIWGIVGLVVISTVYGILNFVQNTLLSLFG